MKDWNPADFSEISNRDAADLGVRACHGLRSSDDRGTFRKVAALGGHSVLPVRDMFVSRSSSGVVRGMHTAGSGHQGDKLVCVLEGAVTDVLVDLRPGVTLGRLCTLELNVDSPAIAIPAGIAHGFQVTSEVDAVLLYVTSNAFDAEFDTGVNPLSLQYSWPRPVSAISSRDQELPDFAETIMQGGIPLG